MQLLSTSINDTQQNAQQLKEEHYWQRCPQRINKIYFESGWAGLGDRHAIIQNLAQIAGYLCAVLEFPPPSILLTPYHNDGNVVSKKVKWQDFENITFLQDDLQVMSLDTSFGKDFDDWRTIPVYNNENFPDWLHVISNSNKVMKDFKKLQEFSLLQDVDARTGFIWEIHTQFYKSDLFDELLPPPTVQVKSCQVTRTTCSPTYLHTNISILK